MPRISSAVYPYNSSAARFQLVITPSSVLLTIASLEESTMLASSATSPPLLLREWSAVTRSDEGFIVDAPGQRRCLRARTALAVPRQVAGSTPASAAVRAATSAINALHKTTFPTSRTSTPRCSGRCAPAMRHAATAPATPIPLARRQAPNRGGSCKQPSRSLSSSSRQLQAKATVTTSAVRRASYRI